MLTDSQREQFHASGFLCGLRVLDDDSARGYRQHFNALEEREGREKTRIGLVDRHFEEPFIAELARLPAILDAVENILGPDLLLMATHFFCKYGREEKFVAWHQDVTYWGLEPPRALTAWYAIDDSDVENGCMRVIPGTHRQGIREHGKSDREGNLLSINQEVPVTPEEESRSINLCLKAGEISLHDGALIHGSLPNRSDRRRCGLTLRFIPACVRVVAPNSMQRPWRPIPVQRPT